MLRGVTGTYVHVVDSEGLPELVPHPFESLHVLVWVPEIGHVDGDHAVHDHDGVHDEGI